MNYIKVKARGGHRKSKMSRPKGFKKVATSVNTGSAKRPAGNKPGITKAAPVMTGPKLGNKF